MFAIRNKKDYFEVIPQTQPNMYLTLVFKIIFDNLEPMKVTQCMSQPVDSRPTQN